MPTYANIDFYFNCLFLSEKYKMMLPCQHICIPNQHLMERFHLKTLKLFHFCLQPRFTCILVCTRSIIFYTRLYTWCDVVYVDDDEKHFSVRIRISKYVPSYLCTKVVKHITICRMACAGKCWLKTVFLFFLFFLSTRNQTLNVAFPLILCYIKMYFVCNLYVTSVFITAWNWKLISAPYCFLLYRGFKWFPFAETKQNK